MNLGNRTFSATLHFVRCPSGSLRSTEMLLTSNQYKWLDKLIQNCFLERHVVVKPLSPRIYEALPVFLVLWLLKIHSKEGLTWHLAAPLDVLGGAT